MEKNWTTVELLRHARHDWLNKIQLIKGNMSIGKMDRVEAIIEEIIMDAQMESKISNINMPLLAELILTGNWNRYTFELTYEMIDQFNGYPEYDEILTNWIRSFFEKLSEKADPFSERILTVFFGSHQEFGLKLGFEFQGQVNDKLGLLESLSLPKPFEIFHITEDNDSFFFEITVR